MNFGERLKQIRTQKGLTQPQFAQMAGIEQSYLSKLENDRSVPSAEMFTTILAGLEMDAATFLQDLDQEALETTLRHIPAVVRHTTHSATVQQDRTKRWMYGAALAWVVGFAMMLAANDGIFFSNSRYTYQSPGVILAGEAENVFDTHATVLGYRMAAGSITIQEMSKQLADFQSQRARPLTVEHATSRGAAYAVKAEGGHRRFALMRSEHVQASANRVLHYLGAVVLVSGFVMLFVEWRLRRLQSRRR